MDDQRRRRDALCSQRPLPVVNQQRVRLGDTQYSLTESCRDLTAANARRPRAPSRRQQWVQALKDLSKGREGLATNILTHAELITAPDADTLGKCHELILKLLYNLRTLQLGVRFLTSRATMRDFVDPDQALTHLGQETGVPLDRALRKKVFLLTYQVMTVH
jgi:hypothetical protein